MGSRVNLFILTAKDEILRLFFLLFSLLAGRPTSTQTGSYDSRETTGKQ